MSGNRRARAKAALVYHIGRATKLAGGEWDKAHTILVEGVVDHIIGVAVQEAREGMVRHEPVSVEDVPVASEAVVPVALIREGILAALDGAYHITIMFSDDSRIVFPSAEVIEDQFVDFITRKLPGVAE